MNRSYYSSSIKQFLADDINFILGSLCSSHTNNTLEDLQKNAWLAQIEILKEQLAEFEGEIYFEFAIPRMGKRVDNIVVIQDSIFVIEFKVGSDIFDRYALSQVLDYTLDLKNFHEGSHNAKLIPVLVATNAEHQNSYIEQVIKHNEVAKQIKAN